MELVERIKQLKAERKRYFDVEGDGVDVLLNDIWDFLEARPTADLGEDGELVAALVERAFERMAATNSADAALVEGAEDRLASARAKVSDRLTLYREALRRARRIIATETLLPDELAAIDAVLSRSGG